jgi:hypothetical protein
LRHHQSNKHHQNNYPSNEQIKTKTLLSRKRKAADNNAERDLSD